MTSKEVAVTRYFAIKPGTSIMSGSPTQCVPALVPFGDPGRYGATGWQCRRAREQALGHYKPTGDLPWRVSTFTEYHSPPIGSAERSKRRGLDVEIVRAAQAGLQS